MPKPSLPVLGMVLGLLAVCVPSVARAEAGDAPRWPPAAAQRYDEAKQLMERGRYAEAAVAYRSVAEWPEGGAFPERAQALFLAGLMQENARNYERAVEVYREAARRFPDSDFGRRAEDAAKMLEEGGPTALEFRRRLDAAWDELSPAQETSERDGLVAARPGLERAAGLLATVLRDFRDHPRARTVALALGDTHMTLRRYEEARTDYQQAIALARRESAKPNPAARYAENDLRNAEEKLAEAIRAVRREWVNRIAWTVLGAVGLALVAVRPWRDADQRLLRLGGALGVVTALLAVAAVGFARFVRARVDDHSPVEAPAAALLVLLPGIIGQVVALGFANRLRGRWAPSLAATLGALAAVAVAACLVHAFELFPFLDSEF